MTPLRADRDFAPEDVEAFLKAGYWNDDTLGDWLRHWSEEDPDGPQIIGLEGTLTNREVYDRAQRMAGALLSMGIVKGQAVGIRPASDVRLPTVWQPYCEGHPESILHVCNSILLVNFHTA